MNQQQFIHDNLQEHIFTSEEKLEWWGYGEWVKEPDFVSFFYKGFQCKIVRIALKEPYAREFFMFGGYLNGYVTIPFGHIYYHKKYEDMDIDCHHGLSFGQVMDRHWIGFDTAHLNDFIPSTEKLIRNAPELSKSFEEMKDLKKRFNLENSPIFQKTYKNIEYCVQQCATIVDQ